MSIKAARRFMNRNKWKIAKHELILGKPWNCFARQLLKARIALGEFGNDIRFRRFAL